MTRYLNEKRVHNFNDDERTYYQTLFGFGLCFVNCNNGFNESRTECGCKW